MKMINIRPEACRHTCKHKQNGIRHAKKTAAATESNATFVLGGKVFWLDRAQVGENPVCKSTVFFYLMKNI